MAGALSLFAALRGRSRPLDGMWRMAAAHDGQGIEPGYGAPDFDDSDWNSAHLPHLRQSTVEQDTLWYRHRFTAEPLPRAERVLLRFGGAFYTTHAWLNGVMLGGHEGYFQPFGFDITDCLRQGDNLLAVRCRFPVEAAAFKRKTAVAGIFADWDCKPYPSAYYPHLPAPSAWTVPIGLWQPASLHASGPLLIEWLNIFPEVIDAQWPARPEEPGAESATLRIKASLRNLTAVSQSACVTIGITPHNFAGETQAHGQWPVMLEGHESRQVELSLALPRPRLWLPWTHGQPWLYQATATLNGQNQSGPGDEAVQVFGVRQIRAEMGPDRWEWWLNGRRVFPKGSNYISDFYLDRVSQEGLGGDIELARGANLDLLRVHAHIAPPDFYRLCDEQGLMVMCDFPLIWTYAFDLPPAEEAAFRASVHQQVEDMVQLLGSRPSIVLWSMHNEPPWTPDGSFLGRAIHEARTNAEMDRASAARVRELDSTRPVIAASGENDQHLYHGWYTGGWRDNRELRPTFPTEFGVQALPNLDSPFWATVNANWPVDADDPTWAHAGYQSIFWASPGAGPPSQYATLADYVAESQAYQAFYVRYVIDQWRRRKFNPVGGYVHFLFTDGWPAITWSVLDYYRLAKAGYQALGEASRPVRVCLDFEDGFVVENVFHLVYPVGAALTVALHLVNDDYRLGGRVQVRWWIQRRDGRRVRTFVGRIRARIASGLGKGRVVTWLPHAHEGSRLVQAVQIPLADSGEYTFHAQVAQGRRLLDENRFDFRVGGAQPVRQLRRRVPGVLIRKVYQTGSLRHTADGFTFSLRNPAMPLILQRLCEVRVDGSSIDLTQVDLFCGGIARRASTITPHAPLDFPSGERLTVVVRERALAPGAHDLQFGAQFLGLGEIWAQVRDKLV